MYVSRYVSRLLVPSSVINSAKREVFINRQKQVGEKTSGNQDSNSTGNQDSNSREFNIRETIRECHFSP